ncbi:hypothetical protein [Thalassiella azotivora]
MCPSPAHPTSGPADPGDLDQPQLRHVVRLDDIELLLPWGTDHEAVAQRVAAAVRDGTVLRLSVEDPVTRRTVDALVNPSRARATWVAPRAVLGPPHIGTPGHR